jgi:hypothetical protein
MKRKFIIVLVVQLLLIFVALTYAFVQQTAANKAQILAEKNFLEAERQRMMNDEPTLECKRLLQEYADKAAIQEEIARETEAKYQKLLREKGR